jgi:hypothetical protein
MRLKRFLTVLVILTLSVSVLASGTNAALDHYAHLPTQNSFVIYDDQGRTLFAYNGDLSEVSLKPASSLGVPRFLHRT